MKRIKRIVATVGEYTDREGKTKKQYANIGTLFERDDGSQAIKLESIPLGWNGWASFRELEQKKVDAQQSQSDDGIPF
jgi:hypothetical protein